MEFNLQMFAAPADIILGDGVFSINGIDIALTRGGGNFSVEREYRQIEADGDYGPVKGRIRKIRSVAKLEMNALEMLPANFVKMYPATQTNTVAGTDTLTAKTDIADADYQATVEWTGKTKGGRPVKITVENAINLENIEWNMVDKDEVVPVVTFTATYLESARTTEPWKIEWLPVV